MASAAFVIIGTFFGVSYFVGDSFYACLLSVCILTLGGLPTWINLYHTQDSVNFHVTTWKYNETAIRRFRFFLVFGSLYAWVSACEHATEVRFLTEGEYNGLSDANRDAYTRTHINLANTINACMKETGWQRYKAMEYFFLIEQ